MDLLIQSIDELRKYVKINTSKNFDTYRMFVADAQDRYIVPYFGSELVSSLVNDDDDLLREYLCRALGPFSLALATDEFSISFGETGHTVLRTDKEAPASDAKIERAEESLYERAWANLDKALDYMQKHPNEYPAGDNIQRNFKTSLFSSAVEFQDKGLVNIDYSTLTFFHLRTLILRIEQTETCRLLPKSVREKYKTVKFPDDILSALQAYTGSRVAMLHTSQTTRSQRSIPGDRAEYKPVIRPLYDDREDTGNYYADQVEYWRLALLEALVENGEVEPDGQALEYNSKDKKIFVAGARREGYENDKN